MLMKTSDFWYALPEELIAQTPLERRDSSRLLVLDRGHVRMTASPREVFEHAWELREIGLSIPQVTQVFLRLREMGMPVDSGVYTIEQAVAELKRLKGGRRLC